MLKFSNMNDTIVLYPALGNGHLMSMVELGKLILTHHPSFSITILILTPPNNTTNTPSPTQQYIDSVSTTFPSINFHSIPILSYQTTLPTHLLTLELSHQTKHHVHNILHTMSQNTNLKAVVLDFLTYIAFEVTKKLEISTYFYYTSSATILSIFLNSPTVHKNATKPIKDLHAPLRIPGLVKNLTTDDYPDEAKDSESKGYQILLDSAKTVRKCDGIIVNTYDAIEGEVISELNEGLCIPDGTTPLIICIGPLITPSYGEDETECLSWLDLQPSKSVIFLCFGSMGRFSKAQLNEIAIGLEKSEQRFMWVVRSEVELEERSLDELLLEGFLERTKNKGMVIRNWVQQVAILSHDSIGGFVTHCGWNSILEAICEGVGMVAWPLFGDQRLNKRILVEEMKVGLELIEGKDGFVFGSELGERVKELMECDKGKEIRDRVLKMKISAKMARDESGSSLVALNKLAQLWK